MSPENGKWYSVDDVRLSGRTWIASHKDCRVALVGSCRAMAYFNWLLFADVPAVAVIPYLGECHPELEITSAVEVVAKADIIVCEPHFNYGPLNHQSLLEAHGAGRVIVLPGWNNYRLLRCQQSSPEVTTESELARMRTEMAGFGRSDLADWVSVEHWRQRLFLTINHPMPIVLWRSMSPHWLRLLSGRSLDMEAFRERCLNLNIFAGGTMDQPCPEDAVIWNH